MKKRIITVLSAMCLLTSCATTQTSNNSESSAISPSSTTETNTSELSVEPTIDVETLSAEPTIEVETIDVPQSTEQKTEDFETIETGTFKWLVVTGDNGIKMISTPLILGNETTDVTDELVLSFAYIALSELINNYETDDIYTYVAFLDLSSETNSVIATTSLTNMGSLGSTPIDWQGKYEQLNNSEYNQELSDRINLKIKNPIESGGYKITFLDTYSFRKVDNSYSQENGKVAVAFDVEIENISSDYEYCTLSPRISTPNGQEKELDISIYFDDLEIGRKCPKGSKFTGAFCVPYDGTGKYLLSFGMLANDGSYEINVDETPEERGIEPNPVVEVPEQSNSEVENTQLDREYILALGYGSYKTENGSIWYLATDNTNTYITYPPDMGYDIDDKAALNIFSDMADILANELLNNSLMYLTASFTVCSPNGTAIATSMLTFMGENNILGLPLCFFGDYEYLNDTEATQRVQSAWNSKSE